MSMTIYITASVQSAQTEPRNMPLLNQLIQSLLECSPALKLQLLHLWQSKVTFNTYCEVGQ